MITPEIAKEIVEHPEQFREALLSLGFTRLRTSRVERVLLALQKRLPYLIVDIETVSFEE